MWKQLTSAAAEEIVVTLVMVFAVYLAVIVYVRFTGLRSFSKMSAADFAMTVAVGSLLAASAAPGRSLPVLLVALAALFVGQWFFAYARTRSKGAERLLDNVPVVLMANGEFLEENMRRAQVTRDDVLGKLREANVLRLEQVRAVVFETTGDISVLHTDDPLALVDPLLLDDVRGWGVEPSRSGSA